MALYTAGNCSLGDFTYQLMHSFWKAFPIRKGAIELNPHWFSNLSKAVHVILCRRIETAPCAGCGVDGIPLRDPVNIEAKANARRGSTLETDEALSQLLWEIEREVGLRLAVITGERAVRLREDVRDAVEWGVKPFLCRTLFSAGIEKSAPRPPALLEKVALR